MAVRTTGAEFKRFYDDSAAWPDDETYHDDATLSVNGEEQPDGIDLAKLADTDDVKIDGGVVIGPSIKGEPSLETHFKRWKKKQSTRLLLVECDAAAFDAVKAALQAAGGRVRD